MATQCSLCRRLLPPEMKTCPHCTTATDLVVTPGLQGDDAPGATAIGAAASLVLKGTVKRQGAEATDDEEDAWQVDWEAIEEIPAEPKQEYVAALALPVTPPADTSPLAHAGSHSRIVIEDPEPDTMLDPGQQQPPGTPAPGSAPQNELGSCSDFDLALLTAEGPRPPDSHSPEGERNGTQPDDYGELLLERQDSPSPLEGQLVCHDRADAGQLQQHGHAKNGGIRVACEGEVEMVSNGAPASARPYSWPGFVAPPTDSPPPTPEPLAVVSPPLAPRRPDLAGTVLAPVDPCPVPPGRVSFWLSGLTGVLVGCIICFALTLAGYAWPFGSRPGASADAPEMDAVAPTAPAEHAKEGPGQRDSRDKRSRELAEAFGKVLQLAHNQRYASAREDLRKLSEAHLGLSNPREAAPAEAIAHSSSAELSSYWRLMESLVEHGYLTARQKDPVDAVNQLLHHNKELSENLHALGQGLTKSRASTDILTKDLQALENAKAGAERRLAHLEAAFAGARDANHQAAADASLKMRQLEAQLQFTQEKLRATELKLRAELARQEEARRPAPVVKPEDWLSAPDPTRAYGHYTRGLVLYRDRHFADAEKEFHEATRADDQDARYQYYLGLARLALRKNEQATDSFRSGARLERDRRPSRAFVVVALDGVPEDALQVLRKYRP